MTLSKIFFAVALAVAASASYADTVTGPIDLSSGNALFGQNNTVGSFADTYTFTGASFSIFGTASTAADGPQNLDFSSLKIFNASNAVVSTFAGNLGSDLLELCALSPVALSAGNYRFVVTGVTMPTQASYAGTLAIIVVPEPETYALLLAGLGVVGFVSRRRKV